MRKLNQTGSLLLPLIILSVFFLGAVSFGIWAFMGRQNYKNNSDQIAAVAAKKAAAVEADKKEADFAERLKKPVKSYVGPDTYGALTYDYPKNWNAYITTTSSSFIINNFYNPDFVPDIGSTALYAFRSQISGTAYSSLLRAYDSAAKAGTVTVTAYRAPKVPSVLGSMITGQIRTNVPGVLVLLPIRDKTIILWTEGSANAADFTNTVLPSVSFAP